MHGQADIAFASQSGRTVLKDLYQQSPLRVLFPNASEADVPEAIILTTSGGMVSGDLFNISVSVGTDANALVTTQAAEKVYRSMGPDCCVNIILNLKKDSWLEWMPQETILFDRARLRRRTTLCAETGARAMAGEILVFGRKGRGETVKHGLIHDEWRVLADGKLLWADNLHLSGDIAAKMSAPAGFGGCNAMATFLYLSEDAPDWLAAARDLIHCDRVLTGATHLGKLLIVRWLGDAATVRRGFAVFWKGFRAMAGGRAPIAPRIWHI